MKKIIAFIALAFFIMNTSYGMSKIKCYDDKNVVAFEKDSDQIMIYDMGIIFVEKKSGDEFYIPNAKCEIQVNR